MTTTAEERVKQLYRAILYAPDFKDAKALITQALHQAQNDKLEEANKGDLERFFEWYDKSILTPCGLATFCHRLGYDFDQIHNLLDHISVPANLYPKHHGTWEDEISRLLGETAYLAKQSWNVEAAPARSLVEKD